MWPRSEQQVFGASERTDSFDAERTRQILGEAAAEQHRRDREKADAYSREELEEMAAEAGISPEALRVAIRSRPKRVITFREWLRDLWYGHSGAIVLTGVAVLALVGVMIAFPVVAYAICWTFIVFGLLVLLGAAPS